MIGEQKCPRVLCGFRGKDVLGKRLVCGRSWTTLPCDSASPPMDCDYRRSQPRSPALEVSGVFPQMSLGWTFRGGAPETAAVAPFVHCSASSPGVMTVPVLTRLARAMLFSAGTSCESPALWGGWAGRHQFTKIGGPGGPRWTGPNHFGFKKR